MSGPKRDILQPNPQIIHQIGLNESERDCELKPSNLESKAHLKAAETAHMCSCQQEQHECLWLNEHICTSGQAIPSCL